MIQGEVGAANDLKQEIERLKDLSRKQRLDIEIKENQVKTLRTRVSQHQEEIENLT